MPGRLAVVVGGSLAGLCAALTLARDGWRVTMLERATGEPTSGAGLGVDRALLTRVTGVDASALPVVRGNRDSTAWELVRALLLDHVERSAAVEVHLGTTVIGVHVSDGGETGADDAGQAVVESDRGEVRADLVVGADGLSSVMRRFVAPDHPHAVYAGYVLWRGLVEEKDVPGGLGRRGGHVEVHFGPGARLVIYAVPGHDGSTEIGRRRVSYGWYDARRTDLLRRTHCVEGDTVTGGLAGAEIPADVLKQLRAFAARHWPMPWDRVIGHSLEQREVFGTPVAEYLPDRLVRGCVALVGDAAHVVSPVTGAGFINGLLDVDALVAAVHSAPGAPAPGSVSRALEVYEESRLQLVRHLVASSMAWSDAYRSTS